MVIAMSVAQDKEGHPEQWQEPEIAQWRALK